MINYKKVFHKGETIMSRAARRKLKKLFQKDIVEFIRIQNHFFKTFVEDLSDVKDPRKEGYIFYAIEEILYTIIMKNIFSIASMQEMTDKFNDEECVRNLCKLLGKEEKEFMPHYVTINECLERLDPEELQTFRMKLIKKLLRKRSFETARFLGNYWLVIIDATQLFYFKEKHCEHCLKKTVNKGTAEEKTYYYHNVLEAKLVLGDNLVISIATEFIENEDETVEKQDCERKAFRRLAAQLKKKYPRLPVCILGDSLYACGPVFEICKENRWEYLIRYKDGSIPTLAKDYQSILAMEEYEEKTQTETREYARKPRQNIKHRMKWISDLEYQGHVLTVMELQIEQDGETKGSFQWVTSLRIRGKTAWEFAVTGRKRWQIENEGFNIQKNYRYDIEHANSLNYNGMKNHYLLTQIADILLQLYENGIKGLREIKRIIKNISSDLLASFGRQLTAEDISYTQKRTSVSIS
jgi:DDE_Tnp_1-associated/Transposase DDE domain